MDIYDGWHHLYRSSTEESNEIDWYITPVQLPGSYQHDKYKYSKDKRRGATYLWIFCVRATKAIKIRYGRYAGLYVEYLGSTQYSKSQFAMGFQLIYNLSYMLSWSHRKNGEYAIGGVYQDYCVRVKAIKIEYTSSSNCGMLMSTHCKVTHTWLFILMHSAEKFNGLIDWFAVYNEYHVRV